MSALDHLPDSGLEVIDIATDPAFRARPARAHDFVAQIEAMERLARAFVEKPQTVMQALVEAAIDLCGADSAGISIERDNATDDHFYHWIATAGVYAPFLDALLPRYPSACGVTLERNRPQNFRVDKRFFDNLHVEAPEICDGLLLPWAVDDTRGTIFIMSHTSDPAFDADDVRVMGVLANFAAMGIRQQNHKKLVAAESRLSATTAMAHQLAHEINNPLQSLTNLVFLAHQYPTGSDENVLAGQMQPNLDRLVDLTNKLLTLPRPVPS